MKTKLGIALIVAGCRLVTCGLGLVVYNDREQRQAGEAVNAVMPQVAESIKDRQQAQKETIPLPPLKNESQDTPEPDDTMEPAPPVPTEPEAAPLPVVKEMPVVEIDGYGYIGFVGIPSQQKELPVMADWSYPKLKLSPCHFKGSMYTDDLVIMAHNYSHHFGTLQNLRTGDLITFTDMDGHTIRYEVVALDILEPSAVEEMTAGEFDLTLFTCTYGGKTRVTVRCGRLQSN